MVWTTWLISHTHTHCTLHCSHGSPFLNKRRTVPVDPHTLQFTLRVTVDSPTLHIHHVCLPRSPRFYRLCVTFVGSFVINHLLDILLLITDATLHTVYTPFTVVILHLFGFYTTHGRNHVLYFPDPLWLPMVSVPTFWTDTTPHVLHGLFNSLDWCKQTFYTVQFFVIYTFG